MTPGSALPFELCVGAATATHVTPDEIVHQADVALYQAKNARDARTRDTQAAVLL